MELTVKFYAPEEGGRSVLPNLSSGMYRPHLVINGRPKDEYLGVQFMGCGGSVEFNTDIQATVKLPYAKVDYSLLLPDVSFVIKEGRHTVGIGYVKER